MRSKSCYRFSYVMLFLLCVACTAQEDRQSTEKEASDVNSVKKVTHDTIRPDNITFPPFEDTVIVQILEGLKICSTDSTKHDEIAPCDHNWFRVFKYMPDEPWQAGFLVEIKAGIYAPTRQVICVYHQKNRYRIANQYLGVVLEIIPSDKGYCDLIMGYEDPEVGSLAILHEWTGVKYQPTEVLEINRRYVKKEFKDSINQQFIEHFYWGK